MESRTIPSEPPERRTEDCAELIEIATPGLYRRNLFRVLGIPVDASMRDVRRAEQRRRMRERLGVAQEADSDALLPLEPGENVDPMAALERLSRPIDRFLDEFFWFWPSEGGDAALAALRAGRVDEASDGWLSAATQPNGWAATHNLAVLHHLLALDAEWRRAQGHPVADVDVIDAHWRTAFRSWTATLAQEELWRRLHERANELDDAQLTGDLVEHIRATLPFALVTVNARNRLSRRQGRRIQPGRVPR